MVNDLSFYHVDIVCLSANSMPVFTARKPDYLLVCPAINLPLSFLLTKRTSNNQTVKEIKSHFHIPPASFFLRKWVIKNFERMI